MQTAPQAQAPLFPEPFDIQNRTGRFPVVCLVEHARNTIPPELDGLGVAPADLADHIGWDIGIEAVTRLLSDALDIPAIYCLYSRLLIDVNRPIGHAQLILPQSDGVRVPGNENLGPGEQAARRGAIYDAYHGAADELLREILARGGERPLVVGMHSCTPRLKAEGRDRPWHIGLSTYDSEAQMMRMAGLLRAEGLHVGIHEPYDMRNYAGVSLDTHGRAKGLKQVLVEIRQDLIGDAAGAAQWAGIMERTLRGMVP